MSFASTEGRSGAKRRRTIAEVPELTAEELNDPVIRKLLEQMTPERMFGSCPDCPSCQSRPGPESSGGHLPPPSSAWLFQPYG